MGVEANDAVILRFGNIEFHFIDNSLLMIFSDTFDTPRLNEDLAEEVSHGMDRKDFEKLLVENGILYKTTIRDFDERYKVVETEGQVKFYFLEDEPEEFVAEVRGLNYFETSNF